MPRRGLFFLIASCLLAFSLVLVSCVDDVIRIIFETNGGSPVDPIDYDGDVSLWPDDPEKTGHAFGGWYTDNGTI